MRILVVSDSHGREDNLEKVLRKERYDAVWHLGDSEDHVYYIERIIDSVNQVKPRVFVRGNCDDDISIPLERVFKIEGKVVQLQHGNRLNVSEAVRRAKTEGIGVILSGHTHQPHYFTQDGILFFNPGSIQKPRQIPPEPTYGIIETSAGGEWIFTHHTLEELLLQK